MAMEVDFLDRAIRSLLKAEQKANVNDHETAGAWVAISRRWQYLNDDYESPYLIGDDE